jgi:cytosine/adenosine deaminase-related metal-dependent hydrolase
VRRLARSVAEDVWRDVTLALERRARYGTPGVSSSVGSMHDPVLVIAQAIEDARAEACLRPCCASRADGQE